MQNRKHKIQCTKYKIEYTSAWILIYTHHYPVLYNPVTSIMQLIHAGRVTSHLHLPSELHNFYKLKKLGKEQWVMVFYVSNKSLEANLQGKNVGRETINTSRTDRVVWVGRHDEALEAPLQNYVQEFCAIVFVWFII